MRFFEELVVAYFFRPPCGTIRVVISGAGTNLKVGVHQGHRGIPVQK